MKKIADNVLMVKNNQMKTQREYGLFLLILILILFNSCKKQEDIIAEDIKTDILRIYSYDSFTIWGLGPVIAEEFERLYDCQIIFETIGEGAALLNHVIYEKDNPQADVVVGIQNTQIFHALASNVFLPYEPDNIKNIKDKSLIVDKKYRLIPFDYSFYAFVYDSEQIPIPPTTFGELQNSTWKDKIILIDPRTSATGYGMLIWSLGLFTDRGFEIFWQRFRSNILTFPASWTEAYTAFRTGEAPIVLSYSTSPAYHIHEEHTDRYKSFIPIEGGLKEIEFAGIISGAKNLFLAKKFIEYMLTLDFQQHVPTNQWMYPVIEGVELPPSFDDLPLPTKDLSESVFSKPNYFADQWLDVWVRAVTKK